MKSNRYEIQIAQNNLKLPFYFPSISNLKANLEIHEYLQLLKGIHYPGYLISAYDIYHLGQKKQKKVLSLMAKSVEENQFVLMDSGNFECFWLKDEEWDFKKYRSVCEKTPSQIVFALDGAKKEKGLKLDKTIKKAIDSFKRSQYSKDEFTVLPIVHADSDLVPKAVAKVVKELYPLIVAVPERELGDGVIQRAKTVIQIKKEIKKCNLAVPIPLHLLGTGNPLSILIFAAAGADCFDGLEWGQTVVDHETGLLHHFHQWDYFKNQTPVGDLNDIPYIQKVMTHNLLFYKKWMGEIRLNLIGGTIGRMLKKYLKPQVVAELKKIGLAGL